MGKDGYGLQGEEKITMGYKSIELHLDLKDNDTLSRI